MANLSLIQTSAILTGMGFIPHEDNCRFLDHPHWYKDKSDIHYGINLQVYIYDSAAGYCCIDIDGDWKAPCLTKEDAAELLAFMEANYHKVLATKSGE